MARKGNESCALDMTPMIDVVFQLMIFFLVTIKMNDDNNPEIRLAEAKNGPTIEKVEKMTTIVEVNQSGKVSMHNVRMPKDTFRRIMKNKYQRYGSFPVLIRGDWRSQHKDIKEVMDICTETGIWQIQFAGIKEAKSGK